MEISVPTEKSKSSHSEGDIYPDFNKCKENLVLLVENREPNFLGILGDETERKKADKVIRNEQEV